MPIDQNAAFGQISGVIDFIANDQLRREEREFNVREEQRRDLREEDQAYRRGGLTTTLAMAKSGDLTPESTQGILSKLLSEGRIQPGDIQMRQDPELQLGPLSSILAPDSPKPSIDQAKGIADIYSKTQLGEQRKSAKALNEERTKSSKAYTEKIKAQTPGSGVKPPVTLKDAITQAGQRLRNLESNRNADPKQVEAAQNRYDMLIDRLDKEIGIQEETGGKRDGSPRTRMNTLKLMRRNNQIDDDNYYALLGKGLSSGKVLPSEAEKEARVITKKTLGSLSAKNPEQYKSGVAELYITLKKFMSPQAAQEIIRREIGIE